MEDDKPQQITSMEDDEEDDKPQQIVTLKEDDKPQQITSMEDDEEDDKPQQITSMEDDKPQQINRSKKQTTPTSHKVVKAATAITVSSSLLILSGLTLAGTVIGLVIATPLVVLFSPVLVPAAVTLFFLVVGFFTAGGLGVSALSLLLWIYMYLTGKQLPGAENLYEARVKLMNKACDIKQMAEKYAQEEQQKLA